MKDKKVITTHVFYCAECGKRIEITVPSEYLYKIAKKKDNLSVTHDWFCSYKCMHEFKAKRKEFETSNKVLKAIEEDKKQDELREARIELEVMRRMKKWNEK